MARCDDPKEPPSRGGATVFVSPADALWSRSLSDFVENGLVRYARHPDRSAASRTAGLSFPVM